jgi:hypothetical protein
MMMNSNLALCRYLALVFLLGFTVACAEPASVTEIEEAEVIAAEVVVRAPETEANRQARAIIEAATAAAGLEGMNKRPLPFASGIKNTATSKRTEPLRTNAGGRILRLPK